ncbi:MAG: succinate dehydrogenase, hydrophobic membrane anchor protein [Rhodospirillaceae bacterium]|nr:succinate dehydrogenase, hydrophobic membrane anchor protein [Rhodospirillaceae bacterium]|tara:strand:- start:154 stop:534 length:381 start_codon:yes stop_codon:yes gene_type:complete
MSLRSPLGRVRGLGSAKSGTEHFWAQRVTAVALIPLTLWFVYSILALGNGDHAVASAWMQSPLNAVLLLLLIVATFHHMQLGLQVVIEDYIHVEYMKIVMLVIVKGASLLLGVAAAFAVLKVSFGG